MRKIFLPLLFLLPLPALAETCPSLDAASRDAALAPHYSALKASKNEREAFVPSDAIWEIWKKAPDAKAQAMLDVGVNQIRAGGFAGAQAALEDLVDYCPNYAEGWNQLAFAKFLAGDLEGALGDLETTLELLPNHFAAIAGKGLTLIRMGRTELGQNALRDALEFHPWMNERHLLPPEEKI